MRRQRTAEGGGKGKGKVAMMDVKKYGNIEKKSRKDTTLGKGKRTIDRVRQYMEGGYQKV